MSGADGLGEVTEDTLLGGKVRLFQATQGFRASTDSVLLAASLAHFTPTKAALELGCGSGGALLPAAHHLPQTQFVGVERDAQVANLAEQGVAANGWADRIEILAAPIETVVPEMENRFDLVFSNPPFFDAARITQPGAGKTDAYLESLPLDSWLKAMLFAARPKAPIVLIHRAAELARILGRLDKQSGQICVLPVRPYPGAEASRVIVSGRKGLKRDRVRLLAGLDMYQAKGGALTERAGAIMQGAPLVWE